MIHYVFSFSLLFSDGDDDQFKNTKQVFSELNLQKFTDEDCRIVQYVCSLVSTRAAYLASAGNNKIIIVNIQINTCTLIQCFLMTYYILIHSFYY